MERGGEKGRQSASIVGRARALCRRAPFTSPSSPLFSISSILQHQPRGLEQMEMMDDAGIVLKARSSFTWLDRLLFLKGLTKDENSVSLDRVESYQCSDVISLEETCKVLFNNANKSGSSSNIRKSRKLLSLLQPEHVLKQQNVNGNGNTPRVELCGEEDRLQWMSGASERSSEEEAVGATKSIAADNGVVRASVRLLDSFASEPPPARTKAPAVTRNRRSVSDLATNAPADLLHICSEFARQFDCTKYAAKTQMLYKFEETRVPMQEHRQQRSGLKRRQSSEENGNSTKRQPTSVPEPVVAKPSPTPVLELAPDHPSKRPADSLIYITYQVFLQAGRGGLTAREAATRIEDAGLGAVFQGLVKPRIKIGKIIRNNPYYFQAGEGRYILCEAIVGVTQPTPSPLPEINNVQEQQHPKPTPNTDSRKEAAAMARREGTARYWAQMNASGRTRVAKNRHNHSSKPGGASSRSSKPPVRWKSDESCLTRKEGDDSPEVVVQAHAKPRLKGMYKTAVGGKPCKRSDGKNWQCPLMAPPNSNYCEHHQKRMMKDTVEAS